ncbi:hypothetical protein CO641_03475 [Lysobacteraceae bacterium NML91-0213]|nr:hypothetical protein CO641_03475 [Xanthomonadaceae bacterium NML91-0213]
MAISPVSDRVSGPVLPQPAGGRHEIARGETLSAIAVRYGVPLESLLAANPRVLNPDVIYPGDVIELPQGGRGLEVRSGDTLSGIAAREGIALRELVAANPSIRNPDLIHPGQWLALPGAGVAAPGPAPGPSTPVAGPGAPPPAGSGDGHVPGGLSERYETGGRGPGTVSTGQGDPGGVSYGSYQLATNRGRPQEFLANEGARWAGEFAGAAPGSAGFSSTWRAIAAREPDAFAAAQHAFIERTHYDVQMAHVERNSGVDLATRSPAVRDAVWSTAVQHGPQTAVVNRAIANVEARGIRPADGEAYDRALIDAIYDERGRRDGNGNMVYFSSSPASTQQSVANRFASERADALAMLEGR